MYELIINIIKAHRTNDSITLETRLVLDLGFSSFELLMLAYEIEDCINQKIEISSFSSITTVSDLIKLCEDMKTGG